MHTSLSKKLLAGLLSLVMVLSLVAPSMGTQAASKYTLTNKTSVKADVTYKYQLKGVSKNQYVKVTRNVSGETVKYNKKAVSKTTKINGTGKTLNLYVTYGEKAENYTGKFTVKVYSKKTNKVAKTLVEKVTVKVSEKEAVTSVAIDNTTPKVGDTITAVTTPKNATNVASTEWFVGNTVEEATTSVGTGSSLKVTTAMVDKFIKVVVKDTEGTEFTAASTAKVTEDKSADVSIIDAYGTNADGTGIVGDRLELTYGVTFGTPSNITWYRDGSVVATNGGGNSGLNNDGGLFLNVTAARGTGVYKATVVADGKTYTTNEFTISATEDKAIIESFTIEDDYTDGTDLTYAATDVTAVATVTMNKNFQGTFRIFKKTDTKYTTVIDTLGTALPGNNGIVNAASEVSRAGDGQSILTADAATNYNVLQDPVGSGKGHIARDGKVTYKWNVNGGLTRGTEYVVVFDQTSRVDDNIGSGTENAFATAVAAPYLTKPEKVEVTKAAKNAPIQVTLEDKDGNALTYFGMQRAESGINAIGAKATSDIYSATKTGVEAKDANKKNATLNSVGSLKAGVWTVNGTSVTGTDAFWFASIDFKKGIYGSEEFTLRSNDKQVANDVATAAAISYNKAKPNDVKVSFGNLRADSTVYLVALDDANGAQSATTVATVSDELPRNAFARVYAEPTQALASAEVSAGAGDYTFTGAIKGITMGDGSVAPDKKAGNSYIAIIVPKDEVNYSPTYTGSTITGGTPGAWTSASGAVTNGVADITSTLTTYKIAGKGEFKGEAASCKADEAFKGTTETALLGYDQFGTELKTVEFKEKVTSLNMTCVNPTVAKDPSKATKLTIAAKTFGGEVGYGIITINAGADDNVNKGESWSIKLSTGQTLTVTATSANDTAKADATWAVSLS